MAHRAYKPLPSEDPRAPAYVEVWIPVGTDPDGVAARNGWTREVPGPEHTILRSDGSVMQEAQPLAPKRGRPPKGSGIEEGDEQPDEQ